MPYSYRTDTQVPDFPDDRPIIIFDGYCVFCTGWVKTVLRHDKRRTFRLMSAQSTIGQALYRHYQLDPIAFKTNILLEKGTPWFKSEAVIRMMLTLGMPWSLSRIFQPIPLALRDKLYSFVADRRFKIAGRRDTCYLPSAADKERFIL